MGALIQATASVTAVDTGTDWVPIRGSFSISISGVTASTVELQRKFGSSGTAETVDSWTSDFEGEASATEEREVYYRLQVTAYSTDTILLRMSQ